jgi:hypothetical protein
VGLWFGRGQKEVVAVAVYDKLEAKLQPFSLVPDASGDLVVQGEIPGVVEYVTGYINEGRYAADSCFVDPTVRLPRFRVSCHMTDGDATARVELLYAQPHKVLAFPFAQFLARRDPASPVAYQPEVIGVGRAVSSREEFARMAFEQLNEVRRAANLSPVKLALAQSDTAARLSEHYFAASQDRKNRDAMNTIALGMLAGWQVGGMIRDATFVSVMVPHTRDAGRWLGEVLAMPLGRVSLMDPNIEEVAFGPVMHAQPDALGAVVTGYRFHHSNDHAKDVGRLLFRMASARRGLKLALPQRLAQLDEVLANELARVNEGQQQPWDALQSVLEVGVSRYGTNMRGYVLEASSLNAVQLPPELVSQRNLEVAVGVTHFKPPGAAWAQLVIVVVFIDHPSAGA